MKPNSLRSGFPVVDSAVQGYRFVWINRQMCLYIAALPFFIKLGCLALILLMGMEGNYLRQGLLLMPSYFAEGWMIGLLIRIVMEALAQKEEMRMKRHEKKRVMVSVIGPHEKRLITASMIVYVLIQIATSLFTGTMVEQLQNDVPPENALASETAGHFFLVVIMISLMLWAVRLFWLYVPVAMDVSIKRYLRAVQPFMFSFYMIGLALLCTIPVGLVLMMALQIAGSLFTGGSGLMLISAFLQAGTQLAVAMISSVAMSFALYPLLMRQK